MRIFGDIVRSHRLLLGVSQEELAHQAGLHRTYISMLERGIRNPSLTVILQLAQALDVKASSLIADYEERLTTETELD